MRKLDEILASLKLTSENVTEINAAIKDELLTPYETAINANKELEEKAEKFQKEITSLSELSKYRVFNELDISRVSDYKRVDDILNQTDLDENEKVVKLKQQMKEQEDNWRKAFEEKDNSIKILSLEKDNLFAEYKGKSKDWLLTDTFKNRIKSDFRLGTVIKLLKDEFVFNEKDELELAKDKFDGKLNRNRNWDESIDYISNREDLKPFFVEKGASLTGAHGSDGGTFDKPFTAEDWKELQKSM